MNTLASTYTLSNGVEIPVIGFGTWQSPNDNTTVEAVKQAIETGYRHIDTAYVYENEESVGQGIRASGINREELFITTKLWNSNRGYDNTLFAFDRSMKLLGLDYLDLYLIHWPAAQAGGEELNKETWRAFETLYQEERIRAIGVSNFLSHHLTALMQTAEFAPMVNQIEFHPGVMQTDTVEFCRELGILIEAWSPLGSGRVLANETLQKIAEQHSKSVAQVCIRWCLQHNTLPLPKSITPKRIQENALVFDFELTPEEMHIIDSLPEVGYSGMHPDHVDF